jgi:hypothetical protein
MKKTKFLTLVILSMLFALSVNFVLADGTETLGSASVAIASGTGTVAAGTGMETGSGTIDFTVPAGATVKQVLLYWAGGTKNDRDPNTLADPGDDTISVNGNSVTGTMIGGPAFFFDVPGGPDDGHFYFTSYRYDITSLGLVSAGNNSLLITDMAFYQSENNGAGVLVIYDDGSGASDIQVRDGIDTAFINFTGVNHDTAAQTFNFAAAGTARTANLAMHFASVSEGGNRPTSIEVTVDGATTVYSNLLGSFDGGQWDSLNLPINIPAGATSLTVQAFSRDDNGTGQNPLAASFVWVGASLSVPGELPPPPPPGGGQGCTPGYWKQPHHLDSWVNYSPTDNYETVFGVDASFNKDLLGALKQGGGGEKALGRHAVAALLNAAAGGVDYLYTEADVIALVQQAYSTGDFEGVKNMLAAQNESGCPLN